MPLPRPSRMHTLDIIRMRKQILAARQRILAGLSPALFFIHRQLYTLVVDPVLADLIWHLDAGSAWSTQAHADTMDALVLHKLAQLP